MLLITHLLASTSVVVLLSQVIDDVTFTDALALIVATVASNIIMDNYGHRIEDNHAGRLGFIHSPMGLIFITLAMTLAVGAFLRVSLSHLIILLAANAVHLLLDLVTSEGIYIRGKRISAVNASYDNPNINAVVVAASLAVIALVLYLG